MFVALGPWKKRAPKHAWQNIVQLVVVGKVYGYRKTKWTIAWYSVTVANRTTLPSGFITQSIGPKPKNPKPYTLNPKP